MNIFLKSTAALIVSATPLLADPAGVRELSIDAPHHGRALTGAIYYPTNGGGVLETYAENPVFVGMPVLKDAEMASGKYPLVLLSHGMGGHIRSLGWLSTGLAEQGAIVIAVNHANSTWRDFDLSEGLKHWTRTQDLKLALDTALTDPETSAMVDPERIMAAGFSYGGWTALSLGGIRGNHAAYVAHCSEYGEKSSHCADLMRGDVGLQDVTEAEWNADYSDPRISSVFAIDPGLIWGMGDHETSDVVQDISLVSLGEDENRLLATDFDLAGLPTAIPHAEIISIAPATHFSMLPVCKPHGAAILEDEGDDPVCTDPAGADRGAVHDTVITALASKLGL
jgi:predicted dienelactone hydrolase